MLNVEYFLNKNLNWNLIAPGLCLGAMVFFGFAFYQIQFNGQQLFLEEDNYNV